MGKIIPSVFFLLGDESDQIAVAVFFQQSILQKKKISLFASQNIIRSL